MVATGVDPRDERRQRPGPEPGWSEVHDVDFVSGDGELAGYVRVELHPSLGVAWFWAGVVGAGRRLVSIVEPEVVLPAAPGVELRAPGLWSDLVVETPLEHVSLGVEAFAVELDDPADAYRGGWGHRVPLGFDLEWETDGVAHGRPGLGYLVPCRVHGEVLVGHERIELDGWGQREHSWGVRDWLTGGWTRFGGRLDDGTRLGVTTIPPGATFGYLAPPGGPVSVFEEGTGAVELGPSGFPTQIRLALGTLGLALSPVAWAPATVDVAGSRSRVPRGLVRVVSDTGGRGVGWVELIQPGFAAVAPPAG